MKALLIFLMVDIALFINSLSTGEHPVLTLATFFVGLILFIILEADSANSPGDGGFV